MKVNLAPTHGLGQLHVLLQARAYLRVLCFLLRAHLQCDRLLLRVPLSVQLVPSCGALGCEKARIFLLVVRGSHVLNVYLGLAFGWRTVTLLGEE